ncbi:ABC transporter substrate-binding protein [Marinivivus vitaminiproducens]|uniref:ABC transporter substrate-binding protein n=1 Tax=Marinivivus vitaminiproducens TaxID=3035935 RepID=UPI00279A9617|nr:ABC transporter substrate-binding protein [Geminicoccaceae bacterium SCSIO 64248]
MLALTRRHLVAALAALTFCLAGAARAEPVTVIDALDRTITLDLPARRVLLGLYFEDYMAIGGPDAFDRVVGINKAAWRDWRPDNWLDHIEHDPSLDALPDIGDVENGSFSPEIVLSLKPDVLVLAEYQYKTLGDEVRAMERAGIPVVVADFHTHRLENTLATIRLLGQIAGSEERALTIATEYRDALATIRDRIERAGRPQPPVYLEFGNGGPSSQGITWGPYMWGAMTASAGGANIANDLVETWGSINPEQILHARPEVIVVTGSEWKDRPGALRIGHGVGEGEVRSVLRDYQARPGWANLPAVRNGRLFALYHGASRTLPDFIATQFLAKAFYPDLFADLDPAANYRSFYERYLPIVPEGTFMTGLGEAE